MKSYIFTYFDKSKSILIYTTNVSSFKNNYFFYNEDGI